MTVYLDSAFLINALFDTEILILLLKLYSKKIHPARIFLSACIGGLSGILVFLPYIKLPSGPPLGFFVPLLICAINFMPCRARKLFFVWLSYIGISFIFSGVILFLKLPAVLGLFLPTVVWYLLSLLQYNSTKKVYEVTLCYGEKNITLSGFLDSGNLLKSSDNFVILANADVFSRLFGSGFTFDAAEKFVKKTDVRVIPYNTVGKRGVIMGIRLDKACVGKKVYENVILGYICENFSDELILSGYMR